MTALGAVSSTSGGTEVIRLGSGEVRISGHLDLVWAEDSVRAVQLPVRYWNRIPSAGGEGLRSAVSRPSGIRVGFTTAADGFELRVRCTGLSLPDFLAPVNAFVVTVDGAEHTVIPTPVDAMQHLSADGSRSDIRSIRSSSVIRVGELGSGPKTVEVWLPQMVMVELLGLEADAELHPAPPPQAPVWVHHGSSVSHCAEADKPTSAWPLVAARAAGLEVVNLAYSGHCLLDPFVADAIANTTADVVSLELGVNVVGNRAMDQRTFAPAVHGFLDRIRQAHPRIPVVVLSSFLWPDNEHLPGPTARERVDGGVRFRLAGDARDVASGALSLATARNLLEEVVAVRVAEGEPIFYLDGRDLYGERDAARHPLPDGLHPDATLYEAIGRRFAARVFEDGGLVPRSVLGRPAD
jgi:hypothetical protein